MEPKRQAISKLRATLAQDRGEIDALLARDYLRVSRDESGRETSPDEQHDDNERHATANGWTLGEPYRDIGSASRYARKARGDFGRLIADLEADRFGAQVLILWESSRGSRRVSEWVELIELCEQRAVTIYVTTHGRMYDPANNRDRRSLLEDAVDSEYESGKTSDRMQRSHEARAAAGRPVGRVSYGYKRAYDARTGALLGRVFHPVEAEIVKELYRRFIAGETLRQISLDWERRGIVNHSERPFCPAHMREMLRNRVYIGERVHIPGRESRWWRHPDEAIITPGQWKPLVSRAHFFAAQAILSDPSRVKSRPGGAKHLVSMFALCDTCEGPMCVLTQRGRQVYRCRAKGCAQVDKVDLEEFAEVVILEYLSDSEQYEGLKHSDEAAGADLDAARAELGELRQHHRDLLTSFRARRISLVAFEAAEPDALRDIEVTAARVRQLETPQILRGLIEPGVDVAGRWRDITDLSIRRRIAQAVLTRERAGQLRVKPSPTRGHRVPIDSRVVLVCD